MPEIRSKAFEKQKPVRFAMKLDTAVLTGLVFYLSLAATVLPVVIDVSIRPPGNSLDE